MMHERNVDCLISTLYDKMMHSKEHTFKSTEEFAKRVNLEDIISDLSGLFQRRLFLLLVLLIAPFFAFNNVTQFLILLEPEHECKNLTENSAPRELLIQNHHESQAQQKRSLFAFNAGLQKTCELREDKGSSCINGHVYNFSFIYSTLVSENDWVCSEEWKTYFVHTIYWTGSLFGVICIGFVSDRYGRIVAIIACHTIVVICGTLTAFASTSFALLLFLRAMMGFVVLSQGAVSFLYVIEYMDTKRRNLVSHIYLISFAVTFALTPLIAYYARNWRLLSIATSAPTILVVFIFALLPESVRWLKTRNAQQMMATLKRVAAINGKEVSENVLNSISTVKDDEKPLRCILKHKKLLMVFVNTNIIWFLQNLAYTGSNTYASNSSDNPFLSLFVCSLLDIIAAFVSNYAADAFGRKLSTIVSALIASVAYISTAFISDSEVGIIIAMTFTGRLLLTIGHNIHYLYAVEVYPTVIRGRALSLRMATGSLGNLLSPQIMLLENFVHCKQLPLIVLGVCCLLSGLIMFCLPETLNKPLPQTLEDMNVIFDCEQEIAIAVKSGSETVAVK